jgi:hypothetical protein
MLISDAHLCSSFSVLKSAWYDIYTTFWVWIKKLSRYAELKGKDWLIDKEKAFLRDIEKIDALKPLLVKGTLKR